MEADYISARVFFPEFSEGPSLESGDFKQFFPFDGQINYVVGNYGVSAVLNFTLPEELKGTLGAKIESELASDIFDKLKGDIDGAEESLESIRALCDRGLFPNHIYFEKGSKFNFYDPSSRGPGHTLVRIGQLTIPFMKKENGLKSLFSPNGKLEHDILKLSKHFGRKEDGGSHSQGSTLSSAVERMVEAYSMSDQLKTYTFK